MSYNLYPQSAWPLGSGLYDESGTGQVPTAAALFAQPAIADAAMPPAPPTLTGMDKFTQLLNNPMFQYGTTLMGAKHSLNPWGTAMESYVGNQFKTAQMRAMQVQQQQAAARIGIEQQTANQGGQRLAQERTQWEAGAPMREAQTGLANAQSTRFGTETQFDAQKMALAMAEFQRQQAFLNMMTQKLGGGSTPSPDMQMPQQPPQGMQPQSFTPQGGVGKFGTPAALLDGIAHVESGNNPNAVNPQSGAMGAYQFMPTTVDMLHQQGIQFNPHDPAQSRDAADYYFQTLMQKHGNNVPAALAAYGGFSSKDPSQYINKVLTAANGASNTQPQQVNPMDMAQAGVLAGLGGLKGGTELMDYAKMMQPQPVPAGGYIRDPQTNQYKFLPDKYREISTTNETAKTAQELQAAATKRAETQAEDTVGMRTVINGMQRLSANVDALLQHPGLEANTGWQGALGLNKIPNSQGLDANVLMESLKSKLVVGVLADLKKASQNGSSGFGQLSEREGDRLETYVQNLNRAQTLPAMKKALSDIKNFSDNSLGVYQERYNSLYGQGGPAVSALGPSAPLAGTQPAAPSTPAAAPKVGTVQGGYVFMGGDPSQKKNWQPAPQQPVVAH